MNLEETNIKKASGGDDRLLEISYRSLNDSKAVHYDESTFHDLTSSLPEVTGRMDTSEVSKGMHHAFPDLRDPYDLNKVEMFFNVLPKRLRVVTAEVAPDTVLVSGGGPVKSANALEMPKQGSQAPEQPAIEPAPPEDEKISFGSSKKRLLMLFGDVALLILATMCSLWVQGVTSFPDFNAYLGPFVLALIFYPAALYVFDSYNMARVFSSRDSVLRIATAALLGGLLSAASFYLLLQWPHGRATPILQSAIALFMITVWRSTYGTFFQRSMPRIRTLIVGAGEEGEFIYRLLHSHRSPYDVRGFLDGDPARHGKMVAASAVLGGIDQLPVIAERTWATTIILATPHDRHPKITQNVLDARLRGLEVLEMATVYERLTGRVPVRYLREEWLLFAEGFHILCRDYVRRTKRLMDICISSLFLVLSAPLQGLTALLIHLDSPGPVLYRQERVGKRGKTFTMIKFRSMHLDAETNGAQWAQKNDPRATRVGRVIRSLRLDELPQLWNILKGDMSLIGPRPERPEFVRQLTAKLPYYLARHSIAPGVTGWAQVNYPYGASDEDALNKLEYDLYYIKNMSMLLDIKILLRTVGVILLGQGS